jgi:hypothetical protein
MIELSLGVLKTRPVAIALLMLVSAAFARIGETEQQIEARYGKPSVRFRRAMSRCKKITDHPA